MERVRQGGEEGVGAGRAQGDGAGRPHQGRLLRQGLRRGGELRDGRGGGKREEGGKGMVRSVRERDAGSDV